MRNGLVVALLLFAQPAAASLRVGPASRERVDSRQDIVRAAEALLLAPSLDRFGRAPISLAGDPDSPVDSVRPLALFAMGPGRLRLDLPSRAQVSVEVFAVNGRRVGGRSLGQLDAGSHDLADLGMGRAPAGIYFARVRAGAGYVQAKFIKLR